MLMRASFHEQAENQEVFDYSLVTPLEALQTKVDDFKLCLTYPFAKKVKFIESFIPYLIEAVKDVIADDRLEAELKTCFCTITFQRLEASVLVSFINHDHSIQMLSDGYHLMDGGFVLTPEVLASRLIRLFQQDKAYLAHLS